MKVEWKPKARKQIRKIPNPYKNKIFNDVGELENNFYSNPNIKALTDHEYDYRLRVGDYRVLINLIDEEIKVLSIEEVKKRDGRTY